MPSEQCFSPVNIPLAYLIFCEDKKNFVIVLANTFPTVFIFFSKPDEFHKIPIQYIEFTYFILLIFGANNNIPQLIFKSLFHLSLKRFSFWLSLNIRKGIVTWTCISMAITAVLILFFIFTDTRQIGVMGSWNMIVYVLLTLLQNGSNMCITTSNTSYMADTIDYELDRSGRYIPAVVSGTYSLIDKLITSVAAVVATGAVAILGYTTTMPQPTDAYTSGIFWMTLAIKYGLPMLGWLITLLAMVGCPLTKEEMVNVQKRIADKKEALRHEVIAENMQ